VTVRIPLLPKFVDANTATGQFVVERDRYIDGWTASRKPPTIVGPGVTSRPFGRRCVS
jgi:hypothetical protein